MRMRTHLTADSASCGKRVTRLPGAEAGIALLAVLFLLFLAGTAIYLSNVSATSIQLERNRVTDEALARAKEALLAYAISVNINPSPACIVTNCPRPGDLPCPDRINDGFKANLCGNAAGTTQQVNRLGRLPWKTLGLPDLRDGSGERLWYAVSNNFKENIRRIPLNSDTAGTITIRDTTGTVIFNGSGPNGVAAVIIAPGQAITRLGSATPQNRSCSTAAICNNAANYLDLTASEDNAAFQDGNATDGFILGPITDNAGNVISNDRIVVITVDEIMSGMQKRVIGEVAACLKEYALNNGGFYPWAADLNPGAAPSYNDVSGNRFGRIPNTPFTATLASSGVPTSDAWPGIPCKIDSNVGWWFNNVWREVIFYGLADAYKPALLPPSGCGSCLNLNGTTPTGNKKVVVLAAGRPLSGLGQVRLTNANKGTLSNYLELENLSPLDDVFENRLANATFNDQATALPAP